jgi:hypothetical protein
MRVVALLLIVLGGLITAFGVIYAVSIAPAENGVNVPILVASVVIGGLVDVVGVVLLVRSQRSL